MANAARVLVPVVALLVLAAQFAAGRPAYAAAWCTSANFGSWSNGGYTLNNDVWGSGAGPQTMCANSFSSWSVTSTQPNTGGVKSYPHSGRTVGTALNSLHGATSSFNVNIPGSGAFNAAYDIWLGGHAFEVMLWMDKTGPVGPLGSLQTTASVGGHTWSVYSGSNGSNKVFSFVRTSNTTSGGVDVRAVLDWIQSRGWYSNPTLDEIQFGYEITSTSGTATFTTNLFSISTS